jgi:hypothetical protein
MSDEVVKNFMNSNEQLVYGGLYWYFAEAFCEQENVVELIGGSPYSSCFVAVPCQCCYAHVSAFPVRCSQYYVITGSCGCRYLQALLWLSQVCQRGEAGAKPLQLLCWRLHFLEVCVQRETQRSTAGHAPVISFFLACSCCRRAFFVTTAHGIL